VSFDGYKVTMEKVSHTVPAYGFIVENARNAAIAYTGDTGPTDLFWKRMAGHNVKCLIVETSFPNHMEKLAIATGHLTPSLLGKEIAKIPSPPPRIFVMHLKPQYLSQIETEIDGLGIDGLEFLKEGEIIEI
jgi:ribonuclease BN (tRNA processing enzyme)